ncbi:MAG: methionine--tRNA ligase, partial [Candidatus Dormibacteria bacterium]
MGRPFYITAAIDYVNASPHLGTAYEKIGCDVLARHRRLRGDTVRFTMGSDEHSQSVERTARERGEKPEEFCARQAEVFQRTWDAFDIHPTAYVRTGSDENHASTDLFMQALYDAGHIYRAPYRAWFCPSCERFYTDREISDGLCPTHGRPVEWVEEDNYFFRLSHFQQALREHFSNDHGFLVPEARRNEILNVIDGGLEDISISRSFTSWGFPLPFDASQVVYVWFDALLSYVTGIGYATDRAMFDTFWPADVHVIGKDITRFHAVMWPAMLMAAGLPLPRRIHAHGWVTLGGQKLSKTRGVFIDPMSLIERFGSDAVRWV